MTQKHFADRIALTRADTHLWTGDADRYFGNGVERQFGGWVGAAMLKAVRADAKPDHHPRALITHFLSGVTHAPITIRTKPMREGRSVSYWQAEMIQDGAVCSHAMITLGELRDDPQAYTGSTMPAAPSPEAPGLTRFKPLAPFADELDVRWIEGAPFEENDGSERSLFWSRGAAGQRLDLEGLAFLADFVPPRVFYVTKSFVPTSTLSMTVYFHAKLEEIEAVGEDFVLVEARGRRIEGGYWDHSASFWSPHGPLLMTTEQLAQHRG